MAFYNRADELTALNDRWSSAKAEYVVIYGRRRVGKSELILHWAEGKRCLYFEATSGTEGDHLEDASRDLAEATGRDLFATQSLSNWRAFFAAVGEEIEREPLLVVLDEFQFVARQTPDIGSELNRFWRAHKGNPNLFLVLSGSDISFFERDVMGYAATTYGRRTGSMRILPFAANEISSFLPQWRPDDLVRAYAVFGGVPYYLEALDPKAALGENVFRHVLAPDALLREEPRFLFSQHSDLREDSVYFSILRAIAAGRTRRNEIAERIGRSGDGTGQMLDRLIEMGLVRRLHPVTVPNPDRTKTVRFAIDDPFLRFWFTFVLPFEGRLHSRADARRHLTERVLPRLDEFTSQPTFEQICQAWLRDRVDAAAVGSWWGSVREQTEAGTRNIQREVDAVAVDGDGQVTALGSCKWTRGLLPHGEKALLRRLGGHLARDEKEPDLYFFARSGFSKRLREEVEADPTCHLVGTSDLL